MSTHFAADPVAPERLLCGDAAIAVAVVGEHDADDTVPVMAFHCSASVGSQWRPLASELARLGHRVAAPDFHGCGGSDAWPGRREFCLADEAAIFPRLADRLGARSVHLVGHSYGGGVALRAALEAPERVASLTLIEPSAFHLLRLGGRAEQPYLDAIAAVAESFIAAVEQDDELGAMARFVDYWNGPGCFAALPPSRQASLASRAPRVALDFRALLDERASLAEYRAALRMPVLIVEGERSPPPSRRICRLLKETLPQAQRRMIAGIGHMGAVTAPERINPAIVGFLVAATLLRRTPRLAA
jgi:pimeloyl-ACP methyl ester carboxylesterase